METFSEKTPSIQEILKWSHSKRMNPRTNRKIKNKGYTSIAVEKIPNKGLGITINDRLYRASKF